MMPLISLIYPGVKIGIFLIQQCERLKELYHRRVCIHEAPCSIALSPSPSSTPVSDEEILTPAGM
jgi:hypothetical protein